MHYYRLVPASIVRGPVRIDPVAFPEMAAYTKAEERLVLVPLRDLDETARVLRKLGHHVSIGLNDDNLPDDSSDKITVANRDYDANA